MKIPMVTMVWVVSRFRIKGPILVPHLHIHISPLTSLGQSSRTLWAPQPHKSATLSPQPGGKTTKLLRTDGGIGGKKQLFNQKKRSHQWESCASYVYKHTQHIRARVRAHTQHKHKSVIKHYTYVCSVKHLK